MYLNLFHLLPDDTWNARLVKVCSLRELQPKKFPTELRGSIRARSNLKSVNLHGLETSDN